MPDAELVREALAGRTEAYAELVRRWAGRVVAICHARTGRADAAEDLAQETLLRGFRALSTLANPDKFGNWLCGIALRACLDWLKARERSTVPFSALNNNHKLDEDRHPSTDDRPEVREDCRRLMHEVERLPMIYRQALMLFYYHDLTYRDLGDMLGITPAAVNARLTRARTMLRERLQPHPVGPA
jgi:RNA polymerase sigma-70 factor (ECF subfamily)